MGARVLRIVPNDPGAGAQVRIVGDDFGRNQQLNLFLGGAQLGGPVSTGPDGSFTVTRTIPAGQAPGSAQISIVDSDSNQIAAGITISNRVRSAPPAGEPLALGSIPSEVRPGSPIAMSGTGEPGIWATVRIADCERPADHAGRADQLVRIVELGNPGAVIGTLWIPHRGDQRRALSP